MHHGTKPSGGKTSIQSARLTDRYWYKKVRKVPGYGFRLHDKKPQLVWFGVISKNSPGFLKRLLKCFSLFQLYICVRPHFLHGLQPNYHNVTMDEEENMRLELPSTKPDIKRFAKM